MECEKIDEKPLRSEHCDLSFLCLPLENRCLKHQKVGMSFPMFIIPYLAFEVRIFVLFFFFSNDSNM